MMAHLRKLNLQVEVQSLFLSPNLAEFALKLENSTVTAIPANLIPADCHDISPDMLPLIKLNQADIHSIAATVAGGCANIQDIYPLTPLQEGILFHHLLNETGDTYLMNSIFAFDSGERLTDFVNAFQAVADRHDILRTTIVREDLPEPVQVVWRKHNLDVAELQFNPLQGDIAAQLAERFNNRHFRISLQQAPMYRLFKCFDQPNHRWLVILIMHHLVIDHTALEILFYEIQALMRNQGDSLPPPIPFRNFVAHIRLSNRQAWHEAYFRQLLGNVDTPTLPYGLSNTLTDNVNNLKFSVTLDAELAESIRALSQNSGISVAVLFHLAYALVVAGTSARQDVVFGTVMFGRMQSGEGAERVLGMFINTLPVHINLQGLTVQSGLQEMRSLLVQLMQHEDASLGLVQRCSGIAAPASLFTALLNYRHQIDDEILDNAFLDGITEISGNSSRTNYPFYVTVDDSPSHLTLAAQTDSSVDPRQVCDMLINVLQRLSLCLQNRSDQDLLSIDALSPSQRRTVLYDWNQTVAAYPKDLCLQQLFEARVSQVPDSIAIVFGEQQLSYAELNQKANQLAHKLREAGVGPEVLVGICLDRSPEMVIALLAVLKAGGAYLALDPSYPKDRLAYMLEDAAPVLLLINERYTGEFPPHIPVFCPDRDWSSQIAGRPAGNLDNLSTPDNLAYVIYTSGSTGRPKGVMIRQQGVVNYLSFLMREYQISGQDRIFQITNLSFDPSVRDIFGALLSGASLYLLSNEDAKSPTALISQLQRSQATLITSITPSLLQAIFMCFDQPISNCLRAILTSGEALQTHHIAGVAALFGERVKVVNQYGPTEITMVACYYYTNSDAKAPIPIGRPVSNTRIYILNELGQLLPPGVIGEIYIAGDGVSRGYLNRPELTAERFPADPFSDAAGARMYRTGDIGRWRDDGNIEYLGRNDHQVKIRGYRVELGEIEAQLLGHPQVKEAVVLAREDQPKDVRLVAYLTLHADANPDTVIDELRSRIKAVLPEYMAPAAMVTLEKLPLTPNNKLDRKALPIPGVEAFASQDYQAPQSETEQKLAAIWTEVLQLEQVGRHDNFFDLGGHSLLAVSLLTKINHQFRTELSLASVFNSPTVAQQAEWLNSYARQPEQHADSPFFSLFPIKAGGHLPAIFWIEYHSRDYQEVIDHLSPDHPVYGLCYGYAAPPGTVLTLRSNFEEWAAEYITEIRKVQPKGPYYLLGHCNGGLLAYEMAQQLVQAGEEIGCVFLMDATVPNAPMRKLLPYHKILKNLFLRPASFHVNKIRNFLKHLPGHLRRTTTTTRSDEPYSYLIEDFDFTQVRPIAAKYTVRNFSGKVILIYITEHLSTEKLFHQFVTPDYYWKGYLPDSFSSYQVSGDHMTMMLNGSAVQIADLVNRTVKPE